MCKDCKLKKIREEFTSLVSASITNPIRQYVSPVLLCGLAKGMGIKIANASNIVNIPHIKFNGVCSELLLMKIPGVAKANNYQTSDIPITINLHKAWACQHSKIF